MSDRICEKEHYGLIRLGNNSFNDNDEEGADLAFVFQLGIIFLSFSILCTIIACLCKNKFSRLVYALSAVILLSMSIYYFVQFGVHVHNKPISVAYALSQYVTKSVRTKPLMDVSDVYPRHTEFEEAFGDIQREALDAANNHPELWPLTRDTFSGKENYGIGNDVKKDSQGAEIGWRFFLVSIGEKITPGAQTYLPKLAALMKKHTDRMVSCGLSMLPPGVRIPPHVGYSKSLIRYMLPLELPTELDKCFLCLNGKDEHWELGKSFVFDDCFEHSVHNDSSQRRIVLYADLLREVPGRPWFSWLTSFLFRYVIHDSPAVKAEIRRTEYLVKK
jgi:aspartyl/asparaginyl beta-hydroxylase (cupin superfamily)